MIGEVMTGTGLWEGEGAEEKELSHSFEGLSFVWVILGDWHWF